MLEIKLMQLQNKAMRDPALRQQLLDTKNRPDPVKSFCDKCRELGYDISVYELLTAGEDFCAAMLRSVNGGGVEAPDGWDDFYGMFISALENAQKESRD